MNLFAVPMSQDFSPFINGSKKIELRLDEFMKTYGAQLYPYAVDMDTQSLILVKIEGNLQDYTTYYVGLKNTMKQVYAIPLEAILDLKGSNFDFSQTLFLFKMFRSGSTLLTNILDKAVGRCEAHCEPNIFTQILYLLSEKCLDEEKCSEYLQAITWVFVQGAQKRLNTQKPLVVLQPQGIGNLAQVLLQKSIPKAKGIYIYRNPIQAADSYMCSFMKLVPRANFLRKIGVLQFFVPFKFFPAFYFQPNYKKPLQTISKELRRLSICYSEKFLQKFVKPGQNIVDYAVKQYLYLFMGPYTMLAYAGMYLMHEMYKMGLIKASILYDNFMGNEKNTLLKLGEILEMEEFLSDENIDDEKLKQICERDVHDFFRSGRNADYKNYDHYVGSRVEVLTCSEIQWAKRTFEQFKKLTGLDDYIIDGTIFIDKKIN